MNNHFDSVTLLITHYNRSRSLERLLNTFSAQQISFGNIVVSDDASAPEHLSYLKSLQKDHNFQLITTKKNGGLGNNINKGQDVVTTPYTLYVQEDFDLIADFSGHFSDALSFMDADKDLDIVRFYGYFKYPYLKPFGNGFSQMIFHINPLYANHIKFYVYSDHPHLRRSNFFEKFGRYEEGRNVDITEYKMAVSFIKNKGRGLFYEKFSDLFEPKNSPDEPTTAQYRPEWRAQKIRLY